MTDRDAAVLALVGSTEAVSTTQMCARMALSRLAMRRHIHRLVLLGALKSKRGAGGRMLYSRRGPEAAADA